MLFTLTFFHQYFRFNLLALVVNCDAPVCKISERKKTIAIGSCRRQATETVISIRLFVTYQHDFREYLILHHVRVLYQDYLSSHQRPVRDIAYVNQTTIKR